MTKSPSTIWMNVTTSANWHRPPVGIVRVERSLCNELVKLYGSRFKQCIWQGDRFVEWIPPIEKHDPETDGRAEMSVFPTQDEKPVQPPIYPILPKRQALVALGQSLLSLTPRTLQPYFNRLLYVVRPRLAQLIASDRMKRLLLKLRRQVIALPGIKRELAGVKPYDLDVGAIFESGDTLISVGLDWDHPYYKHFYTLRTRRNLKIVTCCYDLIPVIYPQYCVNDVAGIFSSYFLEIADGSDLVLCISKQSEKDLLEMLNRTGGATPRTHVFPLGDNVPSNNHAEISPAVRTICKEPFILFVSTIERRKNHEVLYRAYHLLCAEGKRDKLPKLLFVGMQGWGVGDMLKDIELDPLTRDLIVRLNHVTDAELGALYEAAKFCVFPSLYEGWGLPVGEALALGKPILTSDRGSLPEVGGNLAHYVDPWAPRAWADEIYKMTTDDAWRTEWEQKIKSQYKTRTWTEAAASIQAAITATQDIANYSSTATQTHP